MDTCEKWEVLEERPKKTYRIQFTGTVDVIAHCKLEALAAFEGLVMNEIPCVEVQWTREVEEGEV